MNRQQRREAILSDLQQSMRALHLRRRRWHVCLSMTGLVAGLFGAWQFYQWQSSPHDHANSYWASVINELPERQRLANVKSTAPPINRHSNWVKKNSPGVVDRYVVSGSRDRNLVTLTHVDDDELINLWSWPVNRGTWGLLMARKQ